MSGGLLIIVYKSVSENRTLVSNGRKAVKYERFARFCNYLTMWLLWFYRCFESQK